MNTIPPPTSLENRDVAIRDAISALKNALEASTDRFALAHLAAATRNIAEAIDWQSDTIPQ